jgi:hypothetical protein
MGSNQNLIESNHQFYILSNSIVTPNHYDYIGDTMSDFINESATLRLREIIGKFKNSIPPAPKLGNWGEKSNAELWGAVLCQIAVVGWS